MGQREGKFFLTGQPGSGKSTVIRRCVERLREMGFTVGGIATPELRSGGRRVGFAIVDLASGREALMAGVDVASVHRIGRYGVDLPAFESVALPALDRAEGGFDVVAIDEVGPMELFSLPFRSRVDELVRGPKPVIAAIHRSHAAAYGALGTLFEVVPEEREHLPERIAALLGDHLRGRRGRPGDGSGGSAWG